MSRAVSPEGLALIKRLEGFRAEPLTLPDGRVVVGHGHVKAKAPKAAVTEADAEGWLRADLAPVEAALNERLLAPASQAQFDALASFAFSVGLPAFLKSDVLRRFNAGEPIAAACAMDAWRKSRVAGEPEVLDALVRRRAAEKARFLEVDAATPAPSALLAPEIDHAVAILGQPTRVADLPTALPPADDADETARKLAGILGRDPATAHALKPPPARMDEDDEDSVLELTRVVAGPPNTPSDVTGLALFGIAGAGLFAGGLAALSQERTAIFLLLAAPGAVMLIAAAWRLLKDAAVARLWNGALRG